MTLWRFCAIVCVVGLSLLAVVGFEGRAASQGEITPTPTLPTDRLAVLYQRMTLPTDDTPATTQFEWFYLRDPSEIHVFTLGDEMLHTGAKALAYHHPLLAVANQDGWVYVYDLAAGTFVDLHMQTYFPTIFACADGSKPFGNITHNGPRDYMQWSPDDSQLAFVGATACGKFDIYVYERASGTVTNLTARWGVYLMDYLQWSPDGRWLAFTAAWEQDRHLGTLPSITLPAVIASDGTTLARLTATQRTCALSWSPDQRHLASAASCIGGSADFRDAVILTFDPNRPHTTSAPVVLSRYASDEFYLSYRRQLPIWVSESRVVLLRVGTPRGRVNLELDDFVTEYVVYDTDTDTLTPGVRYTPTPITIEMIGEWALSTTWDDNGNLITQADNPVLGVGIPRLSDIEISPFNTHIDATGRFIVGKKRQSEQHTDIIVYDTVNVVENAHVEVETVGEEWIGVLGFVEFAE